MCYEQSLVTLRVYDQGPKANLAPHASLRFCQLSDCLYSDSFADDPVLCSGLQEGLT